MTKPAVRPIQEVLLEQRLLTPEQLRQAQSAAARTSQPLSRVLVQQGIVKEETMTGLLAAQTGVTVIDLSNYQIKAEVVQRVPEPLARRHCLIPVFRIGDQLTVAMADPLNYLAVDEIRTKTGCDIKTVLAGESAIRNAIDRCYGATGTIEQVAKVIEEADRAEIGDMLGTDQSPVVRLLDLMISQAVKERASDIHIEPGDGLLRTRFRVDGVLQEVNGPSAEMHAGISSRVKVLASLDIAEKRKPQDGRFRISVDQREIDIRVSVVPTQFGEKVVLRLLDRSQSHFSFDQLGLTGRTKQEYERLVRLPHGIVPVTGPTGAGKTTTLYTALHSINSVQKNILTIEDPIEYQLPGINQVQVNVKADVTFSSALRAFLRQDPDVIMVGEIRDRQTAEIAIQAALTGHLVLTTLHTNDAVSSLTRLIEMGVEPFLITSSVMGVLAQRLVRMICAACREPALVDEATAKRLRLSGKTTLFRGRGCSGCKGSGYKGRIGIYELLVMSDPIREALMLRASNVAIAQLARREGMGSLWEDGLAKAVSGKTTLEELLRVTQAVHDEQ